MLTSGTRRALPADDCTRRPAPWRRWRPSVAQTALGRPDAGVVVVKGCGRQLVNAERCSPDRRRIAWAWRVARWRSRAVEARRRSSSLVCWARGTGSTASVRVVCSPACRLASGARCGSEGARPVAQRRRPCLVGRAARIGCTGRASCLLRPSQTVFKIYRGIHPELASAARG